MTVIRVTRARVIRAIRNEPVETLKPGAWIQYYDLSPNKVKEKSITKACCVCAVGAVLRSVLNPRQAPEYVDDAAFAAVGDGLGFIDIKTERDVERTFERYVHAGRHMVALSDAFEFLCRDLYLLTGRQYNKRLEEIRAECIRLVKAYFPLVLDLDIDGAKPAADVAVISEDDAECR